MAENETTAQQTGLGAELRKLIPSLIVTGIVAFGASWWNNQLTQTDLRFKISTLEKQLETQATNSANNANAAQANSIKIAEMGIIHQNLLEQIKDLKQEVRALK
jgi:hypothetical protein